MVIGGMVSSTLLTLIVIPAIYAAPISIAHCSGWPWAFEFVRPRVDDRVLIEVVHCSHDAILEFLFGCHTDVAQDGVGSEGNVRRVPPKGMTSAGPPPYSITSSAVANSVSGMVRPSALAVLRLMTNLYLSAACTGRSPGFEPLRMRST
jgi:hypothetical protein